MFLYQMGYVRRGPGHCAHQVTVCGQIVTLMLTAAFVKYQVSQSVMTTAQTAVRLGRSLETGAGLASTVVATTLPRVLGGVGVGKATAGLVSMDGVISRRAVVVSMYDVRI